MQSRVKYPIGIQTFSEIIEEGYLYIDKTEYIYNMSHPGKYVFLSRPRRFGKSLLTSTMQAYFEGRKELFKGLAIEKLEKDWTQYPVIHLDLSGAKHLDKDALERYLFDVLDENAERLGVEMKHADVNIYFKNLISEAKKKYKQNVVILIDEYDAPLLDVVHEDSQLSELRHVMQNFYSPIKKCDSMLKFVFITGITKFSQLSIFSELNNLDVISMDEEYAGICGITESEMLNCMNDGIEALAAKNEMTRDEALTELKDCYDGYHFSWPSEDVYNPYSLLKSLTKRKFESYWFESGTPTYLIEMLRKYGVNPSALGTDREVMVADFNVPTQNMTNIAPLLYQSGYVTIKGRDKLSQLYTLGIPNREIRIGLMTNLLPNYLGPLCVDANTAAARMQVALLTDNIERMMDLLKDFLSTIPGNDYVNKPENFEAHWQQMLYVIFSLLGARADIEVRTTKGRVDFVAQTAKHLYLFELKLNKTAEAAMRQINLKDYAERFSLCTLPVVKIGANFSSEERNITDWRIDEEI